MCQICGQPNYIRCNCQPAQPFCDQCSEDSVCGEKMDSSCVIYHFGNPTLPSRLINLQLPNGSSAQTIFEKIDMLIGTSFNLPIIPIDTPSIDLTVTGLADHTLRADLNISNQPGNKIQLFSDGVYVASSGETFKVKVDDDAPPRFLEDAVIGGTDGCVNIDINNISGFLQFQPSINVDCLISRICASDDSRQSFAECLISGICGTGLQDTLASCIVSGICEQSGNTNALAACLLATGQFTPTGGTSITADNGLNMSTPTNVELGGPLIKTTTIDQNSFQLNLLNPFINIGDNAALSALTTVNVQSSSTSIPNLITNTKNTAFSNSNDIFAESTALRVVGTTFTGSVSGAHNAAVGSQIFIGYTGNTVLDNANTTTNSGLYATSVKYSSGNLSGNIIAAGHFLGFAADTGNVTSAASVLINGLEAAPLSVGANYTGTYTNYYGIYIRDIAGSGLASKVTNKYAIFQEGNAALNSFATAVVVTSDERTKENVRDYTRGLSEIESINIVEYNSIGDPDKKRKVGVIAQSIEGIIPEAVQTQDRSEQNGIADFKVVDYNVIFSTLVNAVKELSAKNNSLEARLAALEAK